MAIRLVAIMLISFLSCSDNSDYLSNTFIKTKELFGKKILHNELGNFYISESNSKLILSKTYGNLFSIYSDTVEQQILDARFGKMGNGPNEFSVPVHIYDLSKEHVSVFDYNKLLVSKFSLNEAIQEQKITVEKEFELPRELISAQDVFLLSENIVFGVYDDHFYERINGKKGIFYYHLNEDSLEVFPLNNYKMATSDRIAKMNINSRTVSLSPDRSRLVLSSIYAPTIEIHNILDRTTDVISFSTKVLSDSFEFDRYKSNDYTEYFRFTYTTSNYIYILYSGKKRSVSKYPNKILVFDWEGKPIKEFIIPERYSLSIFYVDEEEHEIIGLSHRNDSIYKFYY